MNEENKLSNTEREKILNNLQWEINRKTSHIRSFENRLFAALSIDSVIVGILATFYSLNPSIRLYEKILMIIFGVILTIIIGFQLCLWWPKKASEKGSEIELEDRIDLKDLNKQLNKMDTSLYIRARVVYAGLVGFAIQIMLLLIIILIRLFI